MNRPNKHHYIPAFYTKRWTGSDGRLCEFSKPWGDIVRPKRVHPDGTGYVYRLYELKSVPPDLRQQVEERFFRKVDTHAADALKILETGSHNWTDGPRTAWSRFLLSLELRMPEDMITLKEYVAAGWTQTRPDWDEMYLQSREESDPPTLREFLEAYPKEHIEDFAMEVGIDLIDHADVGVRINNMLWATIVTPMTAPELLTSDRPLLMAAAMAEKDAYIVMPIGPRRLFVAVHEIETLRRLQQQPPKRLVTTVNAQVVSHAVRHVYARDDRSLRFVQNHMGKVRLSRLLERMGPRPSFAA